MYVFDIIFKLFLNIYTYIGHFIRIAYQRNLQSIGRPDKLKAARDSQFVGKKKRITWKKYGQYVLPKIVVT